MKLHTDISQLIHGKKPVYPSKRTMNLYFKMDRTTAPATAALYILFVLVICFALFKVLIFDPLNTVKQLDEQVLALEKQSEFQMEQLKDYNQILEDYTRATPVDEELSQVDRMEILSLIDNIIRPAARISKVSITDNKVLVSFSGVTLKEAAMLVTQLEQSALVTNTSVDTAVSTRENQHLAEIHIYFEVAAEEETQS